MLWDILKLDIPTLTNLRFPVEMFDQRSMLRTIMPLNGPLTKTDELTSPLNKQDVNTIGAAGPLSSPNPSSVINGQPNSLQTIMLGRTTNVQYKKRKFQFVFNPNYLAISCDGHPATVQPVKFNYYKTDTTYVAVVNPKSSEETHFYFVNVPKVSNMHWPYNHQIHGCLYSIKVNDKPINELVDQVILSRGTDNFQECRKSCKQQCKTPGAQCLEYFSPFITKCSCFLADGNGPLCDQRLTMVKSHNYTFTGGKNYLFKRIKYSVNLTTLKETEIFKDKALSLLEMKKRDGINMNITVVLMKSKGELRVSFKTPQFKIILTTEGLLNVTESPGVYTIYFQIFPDHIVTEIIHKHAVINKMKVMLNETIEDFGFSYIRVIAGYFDMAFYYTSFCRIYDLIDFKTHVTTAEYKPESRSLQEYKPESRSLHVTTEEYKPESRSLQQTIDYKELTTYNVTVFWISIVMNVILIMVVIFFLFVRKKSQFSKCIGRRLPNSEHIIPLVNNNASLNVEISQDVCELSNIKNNQDIDNATDKCSDVRNETTN